ncbi:MAG: hypothetical protein AAF492_21315, partial [Verrucomicrobiota bacterium]
TDCFAHAALKPLEILLIAFVLPALLVQGIIGPAAAAFLAIWGGSITRTVYTLIRMFFSLFVRGETDPNRGSLIGRLFGIKRFVALWVGMIPTFGNLAYPVQMVYASSTRDQAIGKFMLYDICTRMGEKFPIWGGRDTQTEHFFNRLAKKIVGSLKTR